MNVQTMSKKTTTPEEHEVQYNGYVYTKPGEEYNKEVQNEQEVHKPCKESIPVLNKVQENGITKLEGEENQYIKSLESMLDFKSLSPYSTVQALHSDIRTIKSAIYKAEQDLRS